MLRIFEVEVRFTGRQTLWTAKVSAADDVEARRRGIVACLAAENEAVKKRNNIEKLRARDEGEEPDLEPFAKVDDVVYCQINLLAEAEDDAVADRYAPRKKKKE